MMNQVIEGFIFHIRKKDLPPEASQKGILLSSVVTCCTM